MDDQILVAGDVVIASVTKSLPFEDIPPGHVFPAAGGGPRGRVEGASNGHGEMMTL